jgi:membrane fusion protein (multidrug efflux system)
MADHLRDTEHETPHPSAAGIAARTDNVPPETDRAAGKKNRRPQLKRLIFYGLLLVLVAASVPYGLRLWQYYHTHESTDDAYVVGDIVPLSPRVTGTVLSVHVEEHQQVEAGQLLTQLDRRDFELRLQQAEAVVAVATAQLQRAELEVSMTQDSTSSDTARTSATLRAVQSAWREAQHRAEEAQARLRTREAAVAAAQAEIDRGQARLDIARMAFERVRQLLSDGVVAQQQFDEADVTQRAAQAELRANQQQLAQAQSEVERGRVDLRTQQQAVEQARARIAEAQAVLAGSQANQQSVDIKQAQVHIARALLQQAQADYDYAQQQLAYTTIRAPVAGVIAKKNLQIGQVVQAGRPMLALVPVHHVWVEANFKETQLAHMRPGQKATVEVDAFPGLVLTGTVESISPGTGAVFSLLPPENATGNFVKIVQRVPVKIVLDPLPPSGARLRPGMSSIATVTTR